MFNIYIAVAPRSQAGQNTARHHTNLLETVLPALKTSESDRQGRIGR